MNIVLFDHPEIRRSLLPLTYTRPVADLRVGILTLAEKWELVLKSKVSFLTEDYLKKKFPPTITEDNLYINGALCPDDKLVAALLQLKLGESLVKGGVTLALRTGELKSRDDLTTRSDGKEFTDEATMLRYNWDLFLHNGDQIRADFETITKHRNSQTISDPHTIVYNPDNVFIEEGVSIKAAIINAEQGPVYLGKDSEVQEGTIIQGPFALGDYSQLRLGGKMRPNTTIGPYCKVGGEVGNVIFHSYSNKAHEGFLGNSVIGSWCNLGADTNNSNLKNNYSNVRCWNYHHQAYIDSGLQFCGTIMGDHSKCSINTMLNTGTVVGVSANIHGTGFPSKFVPSFIWGGTEISYEYDFEKACETIAKVLERREIVFDQVERAILQRVFELSLNYRQPLLS